MNYKNKLTRIAMSLVATSILVNPSTFIAQKKNFLEYCAAVSINRSIGAREVSTTPLTFLRTTPGVEAVINGPYFNKDKATEGLVYLADNHIFGTNAPEHIKAYFTISKDGKNISISEKLEGKLTDYWLVIGTHPFLIKNGTVHPQIKSYPTTTSNRSAIGKKQNEICFAATTESLTLAQWANELKNEGYSDALNLDGGPPSQLSYRKNNIIRTIGNGTQTTSSVIFFYKR